MLEILKAIKTLLSDKKYIGLFVALGLSMFLIMFSIPIYTIPGNSVQFQSMLFKTSDYILLFFLAILSSLVLTMQTAIIAQKNELNRKTSVLNGVGVFSGIFSSIFASATCGLCVGALFSFLGFGTVLFLIENRWYILIASGSLLLISLYLSSKRYNKGCELCLIK